MDAALQRLVSGDGMTPEDLALSAGRGLSGDAAAQPAMELARLKGAKYEVLQNTQCHARER